jgi:hypothetical protein
MCDFVWGRSGIYYWECPSFSRWHRLDPPREWNPDRAELPEVQKYMDWRSGAANCISISDDLSVRPAPYLSGSFYQRFAFPDGNRFLITLSESHKDYKAAVVDTAGRVVSRLSWLPETVTADGRYLLGTSRKLGLFAKLQSKWDDEFTGGKNILIVGDAEGNWRMKIPGSDHLYSPHLSCDSRFLAVSGRKIGEILVYAFSIENPR